MRECGIQRSHCTAANCKAYSDCLESSSSMCLYAAMCCQNYLVADVADCTAGQYCLTSNSTCMDIIKCHMCMLPQKALA